MALKGVTYQYRSPEAHQGYYIIEHDEVGTYIGDWRIDIDLLYHRHPEEEMDGGWGLGVIEYDVNDRVCWKCEVRCPDTIWFAHRLQQLP